MEKHARRERNPYTLWFQDGTNSESIGPAKEILETQKNFVVDTCHRIPTSEHDCFSVSELSDLEAIVQEILEDGKDRKCKWVKDRSKVSRQVQGFVTKFSGFLESYSGIVEVVKAADQQYGGLAYGTLSALLIVAVNKSRQETVIEDTMETIQSTLPRMKASREIYPSRKMEYLVAEVYTDVMHFVREAIKYYQRSGLQKLWQVIRRPPQLGLKVDVDKMTCKINEVKEELNINLNERVQHIQKQLHDVKEQLGDVRADGQTVIRDVQEMQQQRFDARLDELQSLLIPNRVRKETDEAQLASYRDLLAHTFKDDEDQATLPGLERKEEYLRWQENEYSCILHLSGYTSTEPTGMCWLSNIVPSLVEDLRLKGHQVGFHLTQRQHWMDEKVPMQDIVSSIMLQLLQLKSQDLQQGKWFDDMYRMLRATDWSSDLNSMCKALVTILEGLGTTYIILDRIDRAKCIRKAPRFVERLLEVLSTSNCHTRILLITSPVAGTEWDIEISEQMREKSMYLEIGRWDQEVNTSRRRKRR